MIGWADRRFASFVNHLLSNVTKSDLSLHATQATFLCMRQRRSFSARAVEMAADDSQNVVYTSSVIEQAFLPAPCALLVPVEGVGRFEGSAAGIAVRPSDQIDEERHEWQYRVSKP